MNIRAIAIKYAAAAAIVVLATGFIFKLVCVEPTMMWVGSTDLKVVFEVKDASSNEPVSGAVVEIASEGRFYEDREPHEFSVVTDAEGIATYECRDNMCYGTKGPGIDTFNAHIPQWLFSVGAPKYESTERAWLYSLKPRPKANRNGPRRSKLVVPIRLQKRD